MLSLTFIPFATRWASEHFFARDPQLMYGFVILISVVIYYIMVRALVTSNAKTTEALAVYPRINSFKITIIGNIITLGIGYFIPEAIAIIDTLLILVLWFLPNRRLERGASEK